MTVTEGVSSIDSAVLLTDLALCRPTTDQATLLHCGRWQDEAHQQVASSRLEASPWSGLLVADEVGLGKTVSAIIALRTLHARGETGGVLIAVPGALVDKWSAELSHRADLTAEVARSGAALFEMLDRIDAGEPRCVITSHGILRRADNLRRLADRCPDLMLTVVDEAHHCRNPRSRLHDAVQLLALRSRRTLLLTATPVNLGSDDLWVQLSLLAPDRWPDFESFRQTMRPTGGLNRALEAVSRDPPDVVALRQEVFQLVRASALADDPRLQRVSALLAATGAQAGLAGLAGAAGVDEREPIQEVNDAGAANVPGLVTRAAAAEAEPLSEAVRGEVADLLRSARPLNDLMVRTRRRDLDMPLAKRVPVILNVRLTKAEWRLYGAARRWSATLVRMRTDGERTFDWAAIMPERMASSCLPAYASHVLERMREAARDIIETDDIDVPGNDLCRAELRLLRRLGDYDGLVEAADALGECDTKYEALRAWLTGEREQPAGLDGGVLLFSQFHGTLNHLQTGLERDGFHCEVLTGRTPQRRRGEIRDRFRRGDFEILLSSEVGSEGLDQQHCHRLVNYDLPWNPMRLEQRIGRIDRFGQQAEWISVVNLCVQGTIDAAILGRLLRRIRIFEESLGMIDPILGRAVRLLAQREMQREAERPLGEAGHEQIGVEEMAEDDDDELAEILQHRGEWMRERALEERRWLGPDPGISALRKRSIRQRLDLPVEGYTAWLVDRIGEAGGQMHETGEGRWMLSLPADCTAELVAASNDPIRIDADQTDWPDFIQRLDASPPPHWFEVAIHREAARQRPDVIHLAPWHPIVRWLVERRIAPPFAETAARDAVVLRMRRPAAAPREAAWLAALEWRSSGLSEVKVRRWMLLDDDLAPIDRQPATPQNWLHGDLLEDALDDGEMIALDAAMLSVRDVLLERERWGLAPMLAELRNSSELAWAARIDRELEQMRVADQRARFEGRETDPRWLTMKQGLVRRLRAGLADRLGVIDCIAEEYDAGLAAPLLVRLV